MTAATRYWEQAGDTFALPFCADCTQFHFYPRPSCPFCGSTRVSPSAASGRGVVYSYSVVHRAPSPAFTAETPYVVAIVQTAEGPHLMTRLVNVAPELLSVGLPVEVVPRGARSSALPVFSLAKSHAIDFFASRPTPTIPKTP